MLFDVACYGTSLTWHYQWEQAVENRLQAATGKFVRLYNMGTSGVDSAFGLANVQWPIRAKPDACLIEFSMNDCVLDTRAQAITNTISLVNDLKTEIDPSHIFLMTMNPCIFPPADSAARLNVVNYYVDYRTLAASLGVGLIDNEPSWEAFGVNTTNIPDGIHPTDAAHLAVTVPNVVSALQSLII